MEAVLKEHAASALTTSKDEPMVQRINIRRSQLFADTITAFTRATFDIRKPLKIRFIGEVGVDDGGPKREFFRLFYQAMAQVSNMFKGYPDGLIPIHNALALSKGHYSVCGAVVVAALLQGAEAPSCFSTSTAHFLAFGEVLDSNTMDDAELLEEIPDDDIQQILRQVS